MVDLAGAEEDLDNHRKRNAVLIVYINNKFIMVLLNNTCMYWGGVGGSRERQRLC